MTVVLPGGQQNMLPASVSVATNLADDALIANPMQISSTRGSTSMFANPFRENREEMVFIDVARRLFWLTHDDSDGGWKTVEMPGAGDAGALADEVVVAVHVDGSVWAFAIGGSSLDYWQLVEQPMGYIRWEHRDAYKAVGARGLHVQYLADRPTTATVFYLETSAPGLVDVRAVQPIIGAVSWGNRPVLSHVPDDHVGPASTVFCGLDSVAGTARVYALDEEGTVWYTSGQGPSHETRPIGAGEGLAGTWNSASGAGCFVIRHHNPLGHPELYTITTVWPGEPGNVRASDAYVDARLVEPTVWEDVNGKHHIFGLVDGVLRVVHQTGLRRVEGHVVPEWDVVPLQITDRWVAVAITRPLVAAVGTYAVDIFPDEYPNQHVMHDEGSVPAAERCAIYTQDVASSWWSREVVRLPANAKPYKVKSFTSRLTLQNTLGAVVPDYPVELTADLPVDVQIAGTFYRCGPNHVVTTRTDAAGQVALTTVARDILGHDLHVSAVGLTAGVSFNPVTDVHSFLGGTGTLPGFSTGITSHGLHDAKTSDDRWVFPAWHGPSDLAVIPDADQVLDWCAKAFKARTTPNLTVVDADGRERVLRGLSIQTRDASRPAYEVVTTAERQAELAAARATDDIIDWGDVDSPGDIFLGIGQGLLTVGELFLDADERSMTLLVGWIGDKYLKIQALWDESDNPIQFIQAVFNVLEAEVSDVLDWLSWAFDWDDVLATKDALLDGLGQLPAVVKKQLDYVVEELADTWFQDREKDVRTFFDKAKEQLAGVSFGDRPHPVPTQVQIPSNKFPSTSVVDPGKGLGPHATWLQSKLVSSAQGSFAPTLAQGVPPEFRAAVDAFESLMAVFEDESVGQEFMRAVEDLESLVTNLFDISDPQALARTEIVTFLDLLEHLILAVLKLADALLHRAVTLIEKLLACVPAFLDLGFLDGTFLGYIWEFICEEAGIDYSSPSIGDIFVTAAAFPMTVVSKAVMGGVPFPDGFPNLLGGNSATPAGAVGPWFPEGSVHWGPEDYQVGPEHQVRIQAMVGVFQMMFTGIDFYMDGKKVAGSNEPPATPAERAFIGALTTFDLIAFGVLDMPVFWGCNFLTKDTSPEEGMWWGEYICKMVIYCGDIVVAALYPLVTGYDTFTNILGTMQGNFGNIAITALGWIEFGFSIALAAIGGGTPLAWVWLISQTLSMASSMTAFMRVLPSYQLNPAMRTAKFAIDGVGDLSSGFWYLVMGAMEADQVPTPALLTDWPTYAAVGTYMERELFAYPGKPPQLPLYDGQVTFPPVGWRFDDSTAVPEGLALVASDDTRPGLVKIAGTPTKAKAEPYEFTVRCANSYDPNMSGTLTLRLAVYPPEDEAQSPRG